jgi:hypothetical protein
MNVVGHQLGRWNLTRNYPKSAIANFKRRLTSKKISLTLKLGTIKKTIHTQTQYIHRPMKRPTKLKNGTVTSVIGLQRI